MTAVFEGAAFSGTPSDGIRADRVAAAVDYADALVAAELVLAAVDEAKLVAAFGPQCAGDEAYIGEVTS